MTPELFSNEMQGYAESIMTDWNAHAGASDSVIMMMAGEFLQDYQRVVRKVGDFYQPQIRASCPDIELPQPPPVRLQSPVVSAIEDAKILGHGTLELLELGAGGALEAIGDAGRLVGKAPDALPWLAVLGASLLLLSLRR
jgi:hypothetical protein